ncbi:amidohydrolase family protein [Nonomuraea spiralis]|uniref:amidohydrolase family protein n=1 Tax=Nonomuraea spiralis TaxID=46182 RepID=UPI0037B00934
MTSSSPGERATGDGHGAWVNTRALRICGLDAGTPDPADGRIEREPDGFPQGTLHEGAASLAGRHVPEPTPEHLLRALLAGPAENHAAALSTPYLDGCAGHTGNAGRRHRRRQRGW